MAQYIKVVHEPAVFKMFARLEKGAEPFPESRCDSYWVFDFGRGGSYCRDHYCPSPRATLKCASKFVDVVENESDANANGVFRLKVGQTLVKFGFRENATRYTPRKISVCATGPADGWPTPAPEHEYYFAEISAADAAKECPEILDWNAAPAPSAPTATMTAVETADAHAREETTAMFAREEIALLRKEIAALRSEMDVCWKRTAAIVAAAIRNLDEKISSK